MPHTLSNRAAWQLIRPRTHADRRSLVKLAAILAALALFVATLLHIKHRDQEIREQTWQSAPATIVDARPLLWMQAHAQGGGAMLYQVEVLARFQAGGKQRERWITISGAPLRLPDAQFKAYLLKGKTCVVRWRTSDLAHPIAEIS
jgi:hypothetical protein